MSNQVCPQMRQEAIAFSETDEWPDVGRADNVDDVKPLYFGLLAIAVERVVDRAAVSSPTRDRYARTDHDPFNVFQIDLRRHLQDTVCDLSMEDAGEPYLTKLQEVYDETVRLEPDRPDMAIERLASGCATAAEATVWHLQNLHRFIGSTAIPGRIDVLRRSHKVIVRNASVGVKHLMLLRGMQTAGHMPPVEYYARNNELRYQSDPLDEALPTEFLAYVEDSHDVPEGEVVHLRDVKPRSTTIGCPILLRPPLVKKLWNRTIDWALERELLKPEA